MDHPAGESDDGALRVDFDRRLKLEFHGSRITSDAGLLAYRELDDALGLTDMAGGVLSECRRGRNTRHLLAGLLRQSVFGRLAGYEDVNDAERLAHDPAIRAVVDRGGLDRRAASTSQMGRFETGWLTSETNLAALADLSGAWIDRVHARRPHSVIVLDMDSSVSETHGGQEGSAYNGHFGCTCYHPLFVFNQFGDLERCALRPGNVHSAADWRDVLEPVIARYRGRMKRRYFRADAAFASPEIYALLEAEGYKYTIRLPANAVLQESIAWLLKRPVGRPPHEVRRYHASFSYRAGSWSKPRRVVAKVEWHPGELYPRVGFIVTNMTRPAERVVAFYNQRGTAEQYIKEGKTAVTWTRLSCTRFAANAVRLQLHALAYNLANFLRTLALPEEVKQWSLTTLRDRLVKIGARIVRHGRSIAFQMAEVMVPRALFRQILAAIAAGSPIRSSLDGRIGRPSGKCRTAWPLDRLPDGRGDGTPCAVPADPRRHRRVASIAAAGPMVIVAGCNGRAGWRRQENCVQIAPESACFPLRRRPPAGQTRRGRQPGAVTVAKAAGSPIRSPLDGRIGRPSGESRPERSCFGKLLSPARRRRCIEQVMAKFGVSHGLVEPARFRP